LKELNRIPGWIVEQDLRANRSGHDVVAEMDAGGAKSIYFGRKVFDDEVVRFQPPGPGRRPSGIGRPAELLGPLSSDRKSPRATSAKAGAVLEMRVKPR
jgi:hypothetical protein